MCLLIKVSELNKSINMPLHSSDSSQWGFLSRRNHLYGANDFITVNIDVQIYIWGLDTLFRNLNMSVLLLLEVPVYLVLQNLWAESCASPFCDRCVASAVKLCPSTGFAHRMASPLSTFHDAPWQNLRCSLRDQVLNTEVLLQESRDPHNLCAFDVLDRALEAQDGF